MKKSILILEDNLSELDYLQEELNGKYEVFCACRTDIADSLINVHGNKIDCLILDLNMNNEFIPDEYIDLTMNGALTGWIWYFYCSKHKLRNNIHIIISSAFADELDNYINTLSSDLEKKEYNSPRIHFLEKENKISTNNNTIKLLNRILHNAY